MRKIILCIALVFVATAAGAQPEPCEPPGCDERALTTFVVVMASTPPLPEGGLSMETGFAALLPDDATGFLVTVRLLAGHLDPKHSFSPVAVFIGPGRGRRLPLAGLWGKKNDVRLDVVESWANGPDGQGSDPVRISGVSIVEGSEIEITIRVPGPEGAGWVETKVPGAAASHEYGLTGVDPEPHLGGAQIRIQVNEERGFRVLEARLKAFR